MIASVFRNYYQRFDVRFRLAVVFTTRAQEIRYLKAVFLVVVVLVHSLRRRRRMEGRLTVVGHIASNRN